jgi:hypothetical protein
MEDRVTPGAFYGSAIAALIGLAMGLMLHGSWRNHSAGPQLLLSSAAAAELARPAGDDDDQQAVPEPETPTDSEQLADLDTGYVDPTPLPVTRLDPDRFDVQPAADDVARQDVDDDSPDAEPAPTVRDLDQPM